MKKILSLITTVFLTLTTGFSLISCSNNMGSGVYDTNKPDPNPTLIGIDKYLADLKSAWSNIPEHQEFYNQIVADHDPNNLEHLETIAEIQGNLYFELSMGYNNIYNMIKIWLDDNSYLDKLNNALNEIKSQILNLNNLKGWNDDLYKTQETLITINDLLKINNDLVNNKIQIYNNIIKVLGFSLDNGITYNQGNLRILSSYYLLMNDSRFGNDIWNNNEKTNLSKKISETKKEIIWYLEE